MKILFIGEIVDKAGVFTIKHELPPLIEKLKVDFVVANANGATGGFGMGRNHAEALHKHGIDVMTSGEYVYYKKDMVTHIAKASYLLRPANFPPGVPGRGWGLFNTAAGPLAVINLLGQSGYSRTHGNNPFTYLPDIVRKLRDHSAHIVLNFHAATTAEKRTMAFHTDGLVSAMMGTGSRILTADAEIFDGGTAVLTDAGRTGSRRGICGLDPETELAMLLTGIHQRSQECWEELRLQGALITLGGDGRATAVETLDVFCDKERK